MFHHDIEIQIKSTNKKKLKRQISDFKSLLEHLAEKGAIEYYKIVQWEPIDSDCRKGKTKAEWTKEE